MQTEGPQRVNVEDLGVSKVFAHASICGDYLFAAGALGLKPGTTEPLDGIAAQTVAALGNLEKVLASVGSSFADVLRFNVYLADMGNYQDMNRAYGETLGDHKPARMTAGVTGLYLGAGIEIECIATRGGKSVEHVNVEGLGRFPIFSHASMTDELVFVSGLLGLKPGEMEFVDPSAGEQTARILESAEQILSEAGATRGDILKGTVYLADMADYREMNKVWREFFGDSPPARMTTATPGLALGAKVEIEFIAARPGGGEARKTVVESIGPSPLFAHAASAGGLVFASGMIGVAKGEPKLVEGGVVPQTERALEILSEMLGAEGASFADVIKGTLYVTSIEKSQGLFRPYLKTFGASPPALTMLEVPELALGAEMELDLVARKPAAG